MYDTEKQRAAFVKRVDALTKELKSIDREIGWLEMQAEKAFDRGDDKAEREFLREVNRLERLSSRANKMQRYLGFTLMN